MSEREEKKEEVMKKKSPPPPPIPKTQFSEVPLCVCVCVCVHAQCVCVDRPLTPVRMSQGRYTRPGLTSRCPASAPSPRGLQSSGRCYSVCLCVCVCVCVSVCVSVCVCSL